MKPITITIKNYKSYGDEETSLDLSGNSVKLIYGNIGAGKTTFVDAIIWALYGETLVNQDEVINRKTNKNCKVEFDFYIGEDYYSITRYRKHEVNKDNLLIFKNHKNISPNKKKDAQDLINEIIGINHKAMINSVMFSSEIYTSFLRVPEGKRLGIIESVLNLKQFQKWSDAAKKLKHPLDEELQTAKEKKGKLEYGIETIENNISEYKEKIKNDLEKLKKEKSNLEEQKGDLEKELEEAKNINIEQELEKIEEYEKVEEHNKSVREDLNKVLEQIKIKEKELDQKSKEYNEIKEKIKEIENIDFKEERSKIEKEEKDEQTKNEINHLYKQKEDINSVIKNIRELDKEVEKLKEDLSSTEGNVCYTCGQNINEEIKVKIETDLNDKKIKNSNKKEELNKEKERIENKNKEIEEKIENLNQGLYNVSSSYTKEQLDEYNNKLNNLRVKEATLSSELISLNNEVEKIYEDKTYYQSMFSEYVENSKYSQDYLMDLGNKVVGLENQLSDIKEQIKTINEKAKNIYDKDYIEDLNKKIEKIKKEKAKEEKIIEEKGNEIYYYDYLIKLLSNKDYGMKKYIIGKMIDLFNKNINKYIPLFFDKDIKVSFDKNLTEEILENGKEISFHSFSSGEKTLLDVAIAFSLYMLVKNFFSSDVRFLVFDEILDRNLDENGINAILNIIQEKSKENSIMVISHRGEYKESFEHKIRVYKEDGDSKIVYE